MTNNKKAAGVGAENGQVRLSYSWQKNDGESGRLDYPVRLQTTFCHYGGVRYWFNCPAVGCVKRIAKLYLGDKYFACRHCYRLAYRSQRETVGDRRFRGAGKIRNKLDWQSGIANPNGSKPKGMHWNTFHCLTAKHDDFANQAMLAISAKLEILTNRVSGL